MFGAAPAAGDSPAKNYGVGASGYRGIQNAELLKFEKELLGFYISSHPLTEHQAALDRYTTASTREAALCNEGTEVTIGGMIQPGEKDGHQGMAAPPGSRWRSSRWRTGWAD